MNRQTHTGDVDASGLGAERVGFAHLHFFHRDVSRGAFALDVYRFRRDTVDGRIARLNLSRFRRGDGRGRLPVFDSQAQIVGLNAVLHSGCF